MEPIDVKNKLIESLRSFHSAMVATFAENGTMHARPMAFAEIKDDGEIWFVTAKDAAKVDEVETDARALVTAQEKGIYVSLSGRIDVVEDRAKIKQLYKPDWKVWFPEGEDDPTIALLRLRPEAGEYWDQRGLKGLKFVFEAAKAVLNGERPSAEDPRRHAKVPM